LANEGRREPAQLIQEKKFSHVVAYLHYQAGVVTIKEEIG
jgi:hypothetical protein